jgi:hypothetical protein
MIDMLGTLYEILKDVLGFIFKKFQRPDPAVLLKQRQEWRSEFERHLTMESNGLIHGEAIIRDITRMDNYPDIDDRKKGISSWFKVEVKGLYHRGVEVILRIDGLIYIENLRQWRYSKNDESGTVTAYLVGQIPFDVIRGVEWNGDEFYDFPHIYCVFNKKQKQPYENLVYCALQGSDEYRYFSEITKLEDVAKSKRRFHRTGA